VFCFWYSLLIDTDGVDVLVFIRMHLPSWNKNIIYQGNREKYFSGIGAFMHLHANDFRKRGEDGHFCDAVTVFFFFFFSFCPSPLNVISFPMSNHLLTLSFGPTCVCVLAVSVSMQNVTIGRLSSCSSDITVSVVNSFNVYNIYVIY